MLQLKLNSRGFFARRKRGCGSNYIIAIKEHRDVSEEMTSVRDSLLAGSVSGVVTRLLTAPLDVLKIRFQLQIEPINSKV